MRDPSPAVEYVAKLVLSHEAAEGAASDRLDGCTCERVIDKLRTHLGRLIGITGFDALLTRSAARAGVHVGQPGPPDGAHAVALIAALFWLLHTFIGGDLTMRAVRQIWPRLDFEDRAPPTTPATPTNGAAGHASTEPPQGAREHES